MNPSTALARVIVDELIRSNVTEVVLSPGSRNAPLSFALYAAAVAGRLRLHVRIDERTAGFLALGLAKATGEAVAVACTSGTAAVNLHPAVVEASHSGTPLVVLTADRPAELRGTGANQTIDQNHLYGTAVRLFQEISAPEERPGQNAYWRSVLGRAVVTAHGDLSDDSGPVHLNVAFREPLVPNDAPAWVEPLDGRSGADPWVASADKIQSSIPYVGATRTLVIVGDCRGDLASSAIGLARARGWPVVAEPLSSARWSSLEVGTLLLSTPAFVRTHKPDRVLVVGRPTLSRAVSALLRDPDVAVEVIGATPRWADPSGQARLAGVGSVLAGGEPENTQPVAAGSFLDAWQRAALRAGQAVHDFLKEEPGPTGLHVARWLLDQLPVANQSPLLILGSSSVVRDVDLVGSWPSPQTSVVANRGAGGIDGTVSTAIGAALGQQRSRGTGSLEDGPAYALMGDLTFLHDSTGLVIGPDEPRPDLCIVVVNDDGGSIFGLLEQGAPEHAVAFERVFGTPHQVDLALLCAASGTPHQKVCTAEDFGVALTPRPGIRVVEVPVDRRVARDLHARLRAAVAVALAE